MAERILIEIPINSIVTETCTKEYTGSKKDRLLFNIVGKFRECEFPGMIKIPQKKSFLNRSIVLECTLHLYYFIGRIPNFHIFTGTTNSSSYYE